MHAVRRLIAHVIITLQLCSAPFLFRHELFILLTLSLHPYINKLLKVFVPRLIQFSLFFFFYEHAKEFILCLLAESQPQGLWCLRDVIRHALSFLGGRLVIKWCLL